MYFCTLVKLEIFFYYSHSSRFSRIRSLLPYLLNIIVIFIAVPPFLGKPWIGFQQKDMKERQPEIFVKLDNTPPHWQNGDSPLSGSLLVANLHWHHFTQCDITKLQNLKTQTIDWKPANHCEKVEKMDRVNFGSPAVTSNPEEMADCSSSHARRQQHPAFCF